MVEGFPRRAPRSHAYSGISRWIRRIMTAKPLSQREPWGAVSSSEGRRSRRLGTGGSWKDRTAMARSKTLLPPVDPGPVERRPTGSRRSPRRSRRLSKFERWQARRLDRLTDRVERRRNRLAVRWGKITRQRPEELLVRVRRRWFMLTEWVEPLIELLLIRRNRLWNRFVYRIASAHWERALVGAGLSAALAVAVIALIQLGAAAPGPTDSPTLRSPEPTTEPTPRPETPSPDPSTGLSTYTNSVAGYLFSYPSDWDVSTSDTATILSDPDGQIVLSFEGAPAGSLQLASDKVVARFTSSYSSPQTFATKVIDTSQGFHAILVGGIMRDAAGTQIQFLAITIQGPNENRAILVHFPVDPDPSDMDALLAVVDSFTIATAA